MVKQLQAELLAKLRQSMQACTDVQRWLVAVSGGLDSMVLLHLAAQLTRPIVVHVNHQLSPSANAWQQHVQMAAEAWGLQCSATTVEVTGDGGGLEQAARDARYQAFANFMQVGDGLLLAHHQDDQAETLLLRLLRGAGLSGLGAMAARRALGNGFILRPLLDIPRRHLLAYAQAENIRWVDDDSNHNTRFDRNYLRHELMPVLQHRWPAAVARLQQTAQLLQDDSRLLRQYLEADLARLDHRVERWGFSISLTAIKQKDLHQRASLIRLWLAQLQFAVPLHSHLQQVEQLLWAREDAESCVAFGDCEIRRFRDRLYVMPALPSVALPVPIPWTSFTQLASPADSFLPASPQEMGLPEGIYHLRFRQGGERCQPQHRQHSQTLKKLLQEYPLEPWLRHYVPLIYAGDKMVAVGNLWLNQ